MRRAALWLIFASLLATLLSGCALPRMIDSDVQSYVGTVPAVSNASFRFDRLPSQQATHGVQDQIEAFAQTALEHVGMVRHEDAPRYLVQVLVGVETMRNPYYRPPRPRLVMGTDGRLHEEWPVFLSIESPWYHHSIKVVLRDTGSGQVAYETTAVFDSPWSDTLNLLPPMLEAAFKDYPQPVRQRVVVELPAAGPGAR
ncbi:MAG: hypothetical protein RL302_2818 [Pseudomonadota bacterium]|jgi:Domain of unknown function (DUF4136)